jgi:hypothetical protein
MRCKIKAPDRQAYDSILSALERCPDAAPGGDSEKLVITAELNASSPMFAILAAGASVRQDRRDDSVA